MNTPRIPQRKSLNTVLGTGLVAVLLASCSSSGGSSPATSPASSIPSSSTAGTSGPATAGEKITIDKFAYSGTMTVKAGSKVTVLNNDSAAHTLTDKAHHTFDTGNIPAGGGTGSFTRRPSRAATRSDAPTTRTCEDMLLSTFTRYLAAVGEHPRVVAIAGQHIELDLTTPTR